MHGVCEPVAQLHDDDLVVAISTSHSRMVLAQATRAFREGIRTLIMTDREKEVPSLNKVYGKYREVYEYYPGDDDTFFNLPNVRKLLARFDPELPIALSDNLWYSTHHPALEAFRCLPCGFNASAMPPLAPNATTTPGYTPRPACPYCTPAAACPADQPHCSVGGGAHGGAGMLLSVGLMRRLPYDAAETCMLATLHCSGGDCLVSQCLWRAGFGFTDPGDSLLHPNPYAHVLFDGLEMRNALKAPLDALVAGGCGPACRATLRRAVSVHVRGKSYPSFAKAAAAMFGLAESHAAAAAFLDLLEDRESRPSGRGGARAEL
ncbi:hypothetical protein GPECTOR_26g538 [Gonium pectorale]|uniref:Uncharacterized protein n=1 Tax=Gonium pectorale TaxID=33097 RepID=A0A150GGA7_GONPE|nr:hypothetical protein GPECTOR_26g538 [Gonium pectorale]|eukprot:KXZ48635.1 hypothetical protein GPECTOR_26g538 [Gonium pectorale]